MAAFSERYPPSKRRAVAALMCDSDRTMQEIAVETGVSYGAVSRWNILHGWRPTCSRRARADGPEAWPAERIVALARVYETPGVEAGDLAEALGTRREGAAALFAACGFPERVPPDAGQAEPEGDGDLRGLLRTHVRRQIGEFDALLSARSRPALDARLSGRIDSGRILRDLAGLARLVEALEPPGEARGAPLDLAAMRESIARRFEAFSGERIGEPEPQKAG